MPVFLTVRRPASRNMPHIPFFHSEEPLGGWRGVIEAVHEAGGKMGPQIWHTGAVPSQDADFAPGPVDSPSGLNAPDKPLGQAMSEEAIADTIDAFARAAADAKALGFDTLEIHGAHGYLIDQFFWDGTNVREDAYGSKDLPGRARFAADILRAVRKAVGPDYPVIIRISQWKQQDYEVKLAKDPKAQKRDFEESYRLEISPHPDYENDREGFAVRNALFPGRKRPMSSAAVRPAAMLLIPMK